ncbi:MAG: hypothetical protein JSW64_09915 [Candidatus Zixiibacteriota bacterium]|nr:MAG: hypothetical protein JSW64_09915 [candidate division Zixibacteria bacterium]
MRYFLTVLIGSLFLYCGGSEPIGGAMELAKLIPDEYKGWKTSGEIKSYNRQTIFDYIDGAGEVYLLYDFKDVAVKKLVGADSTEITVEIFDMGGSEDAFGIFSHSREGNDIGMGGGSEFRDGFLCFWKSRHFVCVYSDRLSEDINNVIIAIGKEIEGKITGDSKMPDILNVLPEKDLIELSVIYFHKQTSLNYHYFISEENILNLGDNTEAVIANYRPNRMVLLCVEYPDNETAGESLDGFTSKYIPEAKDSGIAEIEEGRWVKAVNMGRYFIATLDSPDEKTANSLIDNVKDKISRMGNG